MRESFSVRERVEGGERAWGMERVQTATEGDATRGHTRRGSPEWDQSREEREKEDWREEGAVGHICDLREKLIREKLQVNLGRDGS